MIICEATFSPFPRVDIIGDVQKKYFIEFYEWRNGIKELIRDYELETNHWFGYVREWYGDFHIHVYDWNEKDGMIQIFEHRFNDEGKNVLINIDTNSLNESIIWFDSALEYKKIHKCNLYVKTNHKNYLDDIDESVIFVNEIVPNNYYALYNVGKYDTTYEWNRKITTMSYDFVLDKNLTFCSYRNPRDWHNLSLNDVSDDILGINKM